MHENYPVEFAYTCVLHDSCVAWTKVTTINVRSQHCKQGGTMPLIRMLLNTTQLTEKQWPSKSDKVLDLSAQRDA